MFNLPSSYIEDLRVDILVQDFIELYPRNYSKKGIAIIREYLRKTILPTLGRENLPIPITY